MRRDSIELARVITGDRVLIIRGTAKVWAVETIPRGNPDAELRGVRGGIRFTTQHLNEHLRGDVRLTQEMFQQVLRDIGDFLGS